MAGGSPLQAPKRGSAPHLSPPAKRHRHNYQYLPVHATSQQEEEEEEELEEGEYTETPLGSPSNSPVEDFVAPGVPPTSRVGAHEVGETVQAGEERGCGLDRSDTSPASAGLEAGEVLEEDGDEREGREEEGMEWRHVDGNRDEFQRLEGIDEGCEEIMGGELECKKACAGLEDGEAGEVTSVDGFVQDGVCDKRAGVGNLLEGGEVGDGKEEAPRAEGVSGVMEKESVERLDPGEGLSQDNGVREEWVKGDKNWLSAVTTQYRSPYLTPGEDVEYDSGETNKGGHSEMEAISTSLKGDDSDPFSDIDDSLIDVNEEMDVCKPDSGLQHVKDMGSIQQIEMRASRDPVSVADPINQQSKADDQASGAPQSNQAGESLSDMTSLLVGDRRQEVGDVRKQNDHQGPHSYDAPHVKAIHQIVQDLHHDEELREPVDGQLESKNSMCFPLSCVMEYQCMHHFHLPTTLADAS